MDNGSMMIKVRTPTGFKVFGYEAVAVWMNARRVLNEQEPIKRGIICAANPPAMLSSDWEGVTASPEQIGAALVEGLRMCQDGSGWITVDTTEVGVAVPARILSLRLGDTVIRRAVRMNGDRIPLIRAPNDSTMAMSLKSIPLWWVRRGNEEPYITTGTHPEEALKSETRLPIEIESSVRVYAEYR